MTPEELFDAWSVAWASRDPDEQRRGLEECCTPDVQFFPPDDRPTFSGRDALIAHVAEYTAPWPEGVTAELLRPPDTHHGWSRGFIRWNFPTMTAQAWDIIRIEDGKIAAMLVFAENGGQA